MNRNIVFDTHIEVEDKVMTCSKLYLLGKQHENEVLMLKSQHTYFVHERHKTFEMALHCELEMPLHRHLGHHLELI